MRFVLALLLSIVAVNGNLLGNYSANFFDIQIDRDHPEKIYKAFDEFMVKYKRKYKDDIEKQFRFNNFVKTYNKVGELNKNARKNGYDTKFGINKFSDLSTEEFSNRLSHVPPSNNSDIPVLDDSFFREANRTRHKRQSSSFDLRRDTDYGSWIVGPIKNQGQCACCWGFAVTAVLETANAVYQNKFTSLSDQEVCDCATNGIPGCKGGSLIQGVQYVKARGLSSDKQYPYSDQRAQTSKHCMMRRVDRVIQPGDMELVRINEDREYTIKKILRKWNVPVAVYFRVGEGFKNYESGVLVGADCTSKSEWHAGAIIGYGSIESGGRVYRYWTIKNSWDNDWGEDGYVRIVRGGNWCSIMDQPVTSYHPRHKQNYYS